MLHLMAAVLAAYAAVNLAGRRLGLGWALRLGLAGLLATGLMWLFMREAAADPRAGGIALDPAIMLAGARDAGRSLVARAPPMVIFMDANFGLQDSPYRGLLLVAATGLSLVAATRLRNPGLRDSALTWFGALLVGLAVG
jgi:hypothetical protein